MKKMIPENKLSKRAKKALADTKRVTWGFSPVNRVKESGKVYRREKSLGSARHEAERAD